MNTIKKKNIHKLLLLPVTFIILSEQQSFGMLPTGTRGRTISDFSMIDESPRGIAQRIVRDHGNMGPGYNNQPSHVREHSSGNSTYLSTRNINTPNGAGNPVTSTLGIPGLAHAISAGMRGPVTNDFTSPGGQTRTTELRGGHQAGGTTVVQQRPSSTNKQFPIPRYSPDTRRTTVQMNIPHRQTLRGSATTVRNPRTISTSIGNNATMRTSRTSGTSNRMHTAFVKP